LKAGKIVAMFNRISRSCGCSPSCGNHIFSQENQKSIQQLAHQIQERPNNSFVALIHVETEDLSWLSLDDDKTLSLSFASPQFILSGKTPCEYPELCRWWQYDSC
jgi:hypothetical protein